MDASDVQGFERNEGLVIPPDERFRARATISSRAQYEALVAEAKADFEGFWGRQARALLQWHKPFTRVLDETEAPFYRWFDDGELNVSVNCIDRHLGTQPDKTAFIFEADDGSTRRISFRQLHREVCVLANGLRALGVRKGDRVVIYMPTAIEAVVAMQACARIGAIHSVVFGGFSPRSLQERIQDAGARLVITADAQHRGGRALPLKTNVDAALALGGCDTVAHVVVHRHSGVEVPLQEGRDIWWHDLTALQPDTCTPEWVEAEHPILLLYTSGSTGRPKGVQHASAGYLLQTYLTTLWALDYQPDDVLWTTADIGWITGHSYIAYGGLAAGATQVLFEGIPTYPDAGRFWRMIERHAVTKFYTAPTAIRALIKAGESQPAFHPRNYNLSSLRLLGSVGEPISPETWSWYHREVGGGRCPIIDTWWQTETGAHMIVPLPGAHPLKPGSCALPFPGIFAAVVDEAGNEVPHGSPGLLVIERPWPSMIRTIWGDPERYRNTYFPKSLGGTRYLPGDGAHRDEDGYFRITGRVDDVLNVSGHRLGTVEIESALVSHPHVAEAAVVSKPHPIKGEAIVAYIVAKITPSDPAAARALAISIRDWVGAEVGAIAKPDEIRFGESLPKNRSGKILRRLLRALARGDDLGQDTSTLENPWVLDQLRVAALHQN